MRITKISVKKLFGVFDHEIPLNQESRITILHGPNGVGKTVMMQMLHGLFSLDYVLFGMIHFNEFCVELCSGEAVTVRKHKDTGKISYFYEDDTGTKQETFTPKRISALPMFLQSERRYWMQKDRWREEDHLSKIANDSPYVLIPALRTVVFGKLPGWLKRIRNETCTSVVQTQRLDQGMKMFPIYGVLLIPTVLIFPLTVGMVGWQAVSSVFLGLAFSMVVVVILLGLLIVILVALFPQFRTYILSSPTHVYRLRGALRTRRVKGEISGQRSLFRRIVNSRFKLKSLERDGERDYVVRGRESNVIPEWLLASGEKQLLRMYHHLLFDVEPDTLVIIDEPEMSLHVRWQREFLNDLRLIVELQRINILVATHSPQVVADKHHWLVELDFPGDD